jgi:hypothetical protein
MKARKVFKNPLTLKTSRWYLPELNYEDHEE